MNFIIVNIIILNKIANCIMFDKLILFSILVISCFGNKVDLNKKIEHDPELVLLMWGVTNNHTIITESYTDCDGYKDCGNTINSTYYTKYPKVGYPYAICLVVVPPENWYIPKTCCCELSEEFLKNMPQIDIVNEIKKCIICNEIHDYFGLKWTVSVKRISE